MSTMPHDISVDGHGSAAPREPCPSPISSDLEAARQALLGASYAICYTDGSCEPNPGAGGWGVIIDAAPWQKMELCGGAATTTNNRMEMTAAIVALTVLPATCAVTIVSDSQYLVKGMTLWLAGWRRRGFRKKGTPIPNVDLWRALDALVNGRGVKWQWVRGHNGHALNEQADRLAMRGRQPWVGDGSTTDDEFKSTVTTALFEGARVFPSNDPRRREAIAAANDLLTKLDRPEDRQSKKTSRDLGAGDEDSKRPASLLVPCPFCGCHELEAMWVDWSFRVVCLPPTDPRLAEDLGPGGRGCGAYGPGRATEAEAIAAWNARATVEADRDQVALYQCELEDGRIEHFAGCLGEVLESNGVRVIKRMPLYFHPAPASDDAGHDLVRVGDLAQVIEPDAPAFSAAWHSARDKAIAVLARFIVRTR